MHLNTRRNLHSHHFSSPLSHNLEVSAFGEDGEGDEGLYAKEFSSNLVGCIKNCKDLNQILHVHPRFKNRLSSLDFKGLL